MQPISASPASSSKSATSNGITDRRSLEVIRGHYERYNGGGYPDNLNGTAISIEARIAAVADVFDALTAKRVYKNPMPSREAMSVMTGAMSAVGSSGAHRGIPIRSVAFACHRVAHKIPS